MARVDDVLAQILGEEIEKSWLVNNTITPTIAKKILLDAVDAGVKALSRCKPQPMIVSQHENMVDDSSPMEKEWFVEDGVCGFAWITVRCKSGKARQFINALKRAGLAGDGCDIPFGKDNYSGGYKYWVSQGGQSMEKKIAFASAFAEVLERNGIECHTGSRMD